MSATPSPAQGGQQASASAPPVTDALRSELQRFATYQRECLDRFDDSVRRGGSASGAEALRENVLHLQFLQKQGFDAIETTFQKEAGG